MKYFVRRIGVGLMALGLVGLTSSAAFAVSRPFHLVEHGTATVTADGHLTADGTGTASHLGRFSLHRTATLTPAAEGSDLDFNGHATLTAANGDRLEASIEGVLNPLTGRAVLVYEWEGGTGRFENASGAIVWRVTLHSDQTIDY